MRGPSPLRPATLSRRRPARPPARRAAAKGTVSDRLVSVIGKAARSGEESFDFKVRVRYVPEFGGQPQPIGFVGHRDGDALPVQPLNGLRLLARGRLVVGRAVFFGRDLVEIALRFLVISCSFGLQRSAALNLCPSARPGGSKGKGEGREGDHPFCTSRRRGRMGRRGLRRSGPFRARGAEPLAT